MAMLLDHSTPNEKVVMKIILQRLYYSIRSRATILEWNRRATYTNLYVYVNAFFPNIDIDNLLSDPTAWLVWLECESSGI
jgi:hypothetical protein